MSSGHIDHGTCPTCGLDTPKWLTTHVFDQSSPHSRIQGSLNIIPTPEGMPLREVLAWRRDPAHPERLKLQEGTHEEALRRIVDLTTFSPEEVVSMQAEGTVCACPTEEP